MIDRDYDVCGKLPYIEDDNYCNENAVGECWKHPQEKCFKRLEELLKEMEEE